MTAIVALRRRRRLQHSQASTVGAPPVEPVQPLWRTVWSKLRSRFARQVALVAVAIGAIATVGHFVGGMIGWWHAYELTFGGHKADPASVKPKSPAARTDVQSLVLLPLVDESEKRDGDWFIDMLTSDLTAELSRMPGALVISRDTARTFKGKTVDPQSALDSCGRPIKPAAARLAPNGWPAMFSDQPWA
jgi:hypothetical protein